MFSNKLVFPHSEGLWGALRDIGSAVNLIGAERPVFPSRFIEAHWGAACSRWTFQNLRWLKFMNFCDFWYRGLLFVKQSNGTWLVVCGSMRTEDEDVASASLLYELCVFLETLIKRPTCTLHLCSLWRLQCSRFLVSSLSGLYLQTQQLIVKTEIRISPLVSGEHVM